MTKEQGYVDLFEPEVAHLIDICEEYTWCNSQEEAWKWSCQERLQDSKCDIIPMQGYWFIFVNLEKEKENE